MFYIARFVIDIVEILFRATLRKGARVMLCSLWFISVCGNGACRMHVFHSTRPQYRSSMGIEQSNLKFFSVSDYLD